MPIRVKCPNCQQTVKAAEKYAGKHVKCPGCGGEIDIPPTASDSFDDIIEAASSPAEERVMPPQPSVEMQPLPYEKEVSIQPLNSPPTKVQITGISIPIIDAIVLIATFWIATAFVAVALFIAFWLLGMFFLNSEINETQNFQTPIVRDLGE